MVDLNMMLIIVEAFALLEFSFLSLEVEFLEHQHPNDVCPPRESPKQKTPKFEL